MRMWRHLKLLKRSGQGHDPEDLSAMVPGACAVECPACPQPERNLPADWSSAPAWKQYVSPAMSSLLI
jgi:hypothetical protein